MSRSTSIDFTENQLFPSLISLSPLATGHPRLLQQTWVRSSGACYGTFNLPMARSLGFGFNSSNFWGSCWAPFRVNYASSYGLSLLDKLTRWLIMQKVRGGWSAQSADPLPLLVYIWFQVLFHSLAWGSQSEPIFGFFFIFPLRYLYTISHWKVTAPLIDLEGGPPIFKQVKSFPALLVICLVGRAKRGHRNKEWQIYGAFTFFGCAFQRIEFVWRLFRFRSTLLTESRLIFFPEGS